MTALAQDKPRDRGLENWADSESTEELDASARSDATASGAGPSAGEPAQAAEGQGAKQLAAAPAEAPSPPTPLRLAYGELRSLPVEDLSRVAVGNPQVADVTIVSDQELLLHAKQIGTTSLIIWDHGGRREMVITVFDVAMEESGDQLERLLEQFHFNDARFRRESGRFFVVGTLADEQEADRLTELLRGFPAVANLTTVAPASPHAAEPPARMVRLSVQALEMDRSFSEKIGVKWSDSIGVAETPPPAARRIGDMFRLGQMSRSGFAQTVNFVVSTGKGRILAEPVLVTASGKQASSFMGQQIPIVTSSSSSIGTGTTSTAVELRETGVKLTMTPTVLAEGEKISVEVEAEVSTVDLSNALTVGVGGTTTTTPGFKTRRVRSEIVTIPGETIVMAGLLQLDDSHAEGRVPALGGVPVLGRLFRSPEIKNRQTELVVAVTPELLGEGEQTVERTVSIDKALAMAESGTARQDPRLPYALQVQDRIARAIRYPAREREMGLQGRVKLRLHLFADGTLNKAVVAESSGIEALDAEALKAAQAQAPYPRFPSPLVQRDLWVDVPVIFRL